MVKISRKLMACSIGASSEIEPRHMVAIQLNTLIADGMAMKNVRKLKIAPANRLMPATNMWCAQTRKPSSAMATEENAIAL